MNNLRPIKLLPARERVASALRKAILSQELKEGEELTLESVSEMLGVSITPIREAFQILARDGLINLLPNRGASVLGISEKMIRDHYEVRAILEREAVMAVCRNNVELTDIINAYEQALAALSNNNTEQYSNYNQAFHMEIWTACGNEKIKSLLSNMWNGLSMGHKVAKEDYARISMAEHAGILEALKARNELLVGERMNTHIMRSMGNILTHLSTTE